MKVSGFTFVRNAVLYDYPVVESIQSILPLCDEMVVAVGDCDDGTLDLIESIGSPKIKILHTVWDDSLREGGAVLAVETNKAFDAVSSDSDWAFYIQADEVIHEKDHDAIKKAMEEHLNDTRVEGLLFDYLHFYGSYDYVADSRRWYRHEIRIIRNDKSIRSWKDAQGFRKNGQKLFVKKIPATVYHYGWVKPPEKQQAKQKTFNLLWHDEEWVQEHVDDVDEFDYSNIDTLANFEGTHPAVMQKRIEALNWKFSFDPTQKKIGWKERVSGWLERATGYRIGEYKNYKLL